MDNKQKLEMFSRAIDEQAQADIARITAEMQAKKEAASKLRSSAAQQEALDEIRAERSRFEASFKKNISKCDYDTKIAVIAHRKRLVDEFFADIEKKTAEFAASAGYEEYLKRMLDRVRAEISLDDGTTVYARPADTELVKKLTSCVVKPDPSIVLGGICASCSEKNLYTDLTLDKAVAEERKAFSLKSELRL